VWLYHLLYYIYRCDYIYRCGQRDNCLHSQCRYDAIRLVCNWQLRPTYSPTLSVMENKYWPKCDTYRYGYRQVFWPVKWSWIYSYFVLTRAEIQRKSTKVRGSVLKTWHWLTEWWKLTRGGGNVCISSNRSRALNTSQVSNISRESWFTYWSSLTGVHCASLVCVMTRYETINILASLFHIADLMASIRGNMVHMFPPPCVRQVWFIPHVHLRRFQVKWVTNCLHFRD